jgi:DNA-binding transcriptional LysR family regulator
MPLSLRALRSFVVLAEELHFGAAAERLHMTQPPLSQQIRQLEAALATELFSRTTRSVQLTVAGKVLLERARRLLADCDAMADEVKRAARGEVGRLVLGFPYTAAYRLLPRAIALYKQRYPDVELDLRDKLSNDLLADLRSRRLDVALVRANAAMLGNDLECTLAAREEMVLAVPRSHALAQLEVVPIARLEGVPFIGFAGQGSRYFRESLENIFAAGRIRPHITQESVLPTVLALVEAGLGVALVPASVTRMHSDELVYRPISGVGEAGIAALHCVRRKDEASPVVLNFFATVEAVGEGVLQPFAPA